MDPEVRYELCDVPPPQASCAVAGSRDSGVWDHYKALCPVDCAGLLGNGRCELRCNISSCAFDRGDCGVGLQVAAVLGGFVIKEEASGNKMTLMLGGGMAMGVLIGLCILRVVLSKKKSQELKLRGYTLEERTGMDGAAILLPFFCHARRPLYALSRHTLHSTPRSWLHILSMRGRDRRHLNPAGYLYLHFNEFARSAVAGARSVGERRVLIGILCAVADARTMRDATLLSGQCCTLRWCTCFIDSDTLILVSTYI